MLRPGSAAPLSHSLTLAAQPSGVATPIKENRANVLNKRSDKQVPMKFGWKFVNHNGRHLHTLKPATVTVGHLVCRCSSPPSLPPFSSRCLLRLHCPAAAIDTPLTWDTVVVSDNAGSPARKMVHYSCSVGGEIQTAVKSRQRHILLSPSTGLMLSLTSCVLSAATSRVAAWKASECPGVSVACPGAFLWSRVVLTQILAKFYYHIHHKIGLHLAWCYLSLLLVLVAHLDIAPCS
jgi:hypothetical protein